MHVQRGKMNRPTRCYRIQMLPAIGSSKRDATPRWTTRSHRRPTLIQTAQPVSPGSVNFRIIWHVLFTLNGTKSERVYDLGKSAHASPQVGALERGLIRP